MGLWLVRVGRPWLGLGWGEWFFFCFALLCVALFCFEIQIFTRVCVDRF